MQKKAVVLLFGGISEERLVSVASAQNLAEQYAFAELIFQNKEQELFVVSKDELAQHKDVFIKEFIPTQSSFAKNLEQALDFFKDKVVFIALHGTQGENGQIQNLLESERIGFTGSGSDSSFAAFEKNEAKKILSNTDIQMAEELKVNSKTIRRSYDKLEAFLLVHKKIVIKPTASGSSFGLHIVDSVTSLQKACDEIQTSQYDTYIAEKFIKGRELTVGIVQIGSELVALPASEIILNEGRAFDYEGKYLGAGTTEVTPAELDEDELGAAQKLAVDAHLALGCYGYSRTDMILTAEGPYFLETNTLPGLSKPSFLPQQLLAADITFKNFIEAQVELAGQRYETE